MTITESIRARALRRDDSGVSLIEVVVALSLLMVLGVTVAAGLLAVQRSAMTSTQRSAGANLATREVEIVRNWFHSSDSAPLAVMTAGDATNASPLPGQTGSLVVDNVAYTVKRQVAWMIAGAGASACDGGSVVSYPSVSLHVEVTWANMGAVPAVVSDTILTPPKSVLNATYGYLAVKVVNSAGTPNAGRIVTASGPSGNFSDTTGPDGCATFVLSLPGTYTAALTEGSTGFVSFNGSSSQTASITTGSLVVRTFTYDLGESFRVTLTPPGGYALPASLPATTLGNSGILPAGLSSFTSTAGGTTVIGPVWPFASGYSIWAGSCPDSDPALDTGRPTALVPTKGTTTSTTAALQGIAVTTTRLGLRQSAQVSATYAGPGSCPAGDSVLNLGTSSSLGTLNTSLPYGSWTLSTSIGGQNVSALVDVSSAGVVSATLNGTT